MIARLRDEPFGRLTSHFFHALFDFGVLSQAGSDGLIRVILGSVSTMLALGLVLVRVYAGKYQALGGAPDAGLYLQALAADDALAVGLPMWIVAFVAALVSPSLFPDETDFRVLTPLPIRRSSIFGAKLVALGLFAGVFTVTTHAAMTPLVLLISAGRWASDPMPLRVGVYWVSGVCSSLFALLAVASATGVLTVCMPRTQRHRGAAALRSGLLGALMLSVPLVLKLPAASGLFASRSSLLYLAPPAWFVGVERLMLGHRDPFFVHLAQLAAMALAAVSLVSAISYIVLYRRFDRVMLRSFAVSRDKRSWRMSWPAWNDSSPARAAVRDFAVATLRRSALHQGVVIGLSACGVAIALNTLLGAGVVPWLQDLAPASRRIQVAALWAPFALILVMTVAARAALALPVEPRANWVFRMTEDSATRRDQLQGAARVMTEIGVVVPVVLMLPLQWALFGPIAVMAFAVTLGGGLLVVELSLQGWRRIPFTCSYLPGKRAVAHTAVTGVAGFTLFATFGGILAQTSMRNPRGGIVIVGVLSVVLFVLRRTRIARWTEEPLMFDDQLPDEIQVLRLHQ
jgi:hypothetical protein